MAESIEPNVKPVEVTEEVSEEDDLEEADYTASADLASIDASKGWCPPPEVKLASWDPENEKQWTVSIGVFSY